MRKQTKIAVGLTAAALLAIGASMSAFAAKGWTNENGTWYYYDRNGDAECNKWRSYNGNYFYLGDDGAMLTNTVIDDNGNYYYVDANGAMVKNRWVPVEADDEDHDLDVEYRWYYFTATGKAYRNKDKVAINGKKYGFDDYGKMLFGFVDGARSIIYDVDDPVLQSTYYYGTNDDGAMHVGWLKYEDGMDTDQYDDEFYYFYYNKDGKKVVNTEKKISGKKYSFDDNGVMNSEWEKEVDPITLDVTYKYFSGKDDGSLKKRAWVYAIPSEDLHQKDHDEDNYRWFYVLNDGTVFTDEVKVINNKSYVFDEFGRMQTGLVYLKDEAAKGSTFISKWDLDKTKAADLYADDYTDGYLHYFSNDEVHDGAMKTGNSFKLSLADDDYTFAFKKNSGVALEGIVNNKVYRRGILQNAGDDKYKIVAAGTSAAKAGEPAANNKLFLVNSTGTRIKENHYYKDADGYYVMALDGDDDINGYIIGAYESTADAKKDYEAYKAGTITGPDDAASLAIKHAELDGTTYDAIWVKN